MKIVVGKFKNRWQGLENPDDLGKFIYDLLSNVVITNDTIKAYINYDMMTGKLCDFDIEIAKNEREKLMRIWRT
jgi:hypothetical protein